MCLSFRTAGMSKSSSTYRRTCSSREETSFSFDFRASRSSVEAASSVSMSLTSAMAFSTGIVPAFGAICLAPAQEARSFCAFCSGSRYGLVPGYGSSFDADFNSVSAFSNWISYRERYWLTIRSRSFFGPEMLTNFIFSITKHTPFLAFCQAGEDFRSAQAVTDPLDGGNDFSDLLFLKIEVGV